MAGPLEGVTVVELAGLGPGPVRRHAAGRHGRRRDPRRPGRAGARRRPRRAVKGDVYGPGPPLGRRRPQAPRRRRGGAPADRRGRRAHRGLPARRGRAARARSRRLPGPQPAAGLRPDDRLGPGRPLRRDAPATTSTTSPWPAPLAAHRPGRPAADRRRSTWSATSAAAACCWPSASCCALVERAGPGEGQVIDAAMVDGVALLTTPDRHAYATGGIWQRRAGHQLLDSGAHFYDVYEMRRRRATCRSGPSSPSSTPTSWPASGSTTRTCPPRATRTAWPGDRAGRRRRPHPRPRRVDGDLRR